LDLHHSDRIRIAATGFEADTLFDHFGEDSGHSWQEISDPNLSSSGILVIASDYIGQVGIDLLDPSDPIGHFGKFFSWDARLSNLPFASANSEQLANSGWRLRLRTAGWGFEETVRWSGRNAPFA
jgi:hypothetical protein